MADENSLPGYDGVTSIDGVTRALHILTHAYMTGEVVSRATALRGASIRLRPVRPGSFIFDLIVLMETNPATTGATIALGGPPFYDFLKTAWRRGIGILDAEPETPHLRNLYERKEPPLLKRPPADLDELAEQLEGSLQAAHRPIGIDGTISSIHVGSSRQVLIEMNEDSKGWVNTRDESSHLETLRGNVTRFNALSRNGRAFVDRLERVIPIRPDGDFNTDDLKYLTWSLHGSNVGAQNKIDMQVRRVVSANGKVKRLLLVGCQRSPFE